MRRNVRSTMSMTREEWEKLEYLSNMAGMRPSVYLHTCLVAKLHELLPAGGRDDGVFQMMRRLKRAGQGWNEITSSNLEEDVENATKG